MNMNINISTFKIIIFTLIFTVCNEAFSQKFCPKFTPEQEGLILAAYYKGLPENLGYTLAAITWKESFVGKWVVKVNNRYNPKKDKHYESYGVTHIELTTAMYLVGMKNYWQARAEIVPRLINDNNYAWELALMKLKTLRRHSWEEKVKRYNGIGSVSYGKEVVDKVRTLQYCYKFEKSYLKETNFWGIKKIV